MRRCPTPEPIPREYVPSVSSRVESVSRYLRENVASLSTFRRDKTQRITFSINTLNAIIEGYHDDVVPRLLRARFRAAARTAYDELSRASNEIVGTAYQARYPGQQQPVETKYLKTHAFQIENALVRTIRLEKQLLLWLKRAQKRRQPLQKPSA